MMFEAFSSTDVTWGDAWNCPTKLKKHSTTLQMQIKNLKIIKKKSIMYF